MRLLDVQPKKNFSYIFVQFPGMKMNVPMQEVAEGKAVKEDIALCLQLTRRKRVKDLYLVRVQSIKPFEFEEAGAKASYRVIKKKETSLDSPSEDIVTFITDEVAVVQKKTEKGYTFVLLFNKREMGIVAAMEEKVAQPQERPVHPKEQAAEPAAMNAAGKKQEIVFARRVKKRIILGGHVFQAYGVLEPIRILLEGAKRKVPIFSPAALDFIGPGDQNQTIQFRGGCFEARPKTSY